jgi:hypothetical protein
LSSLHALDQSILAGLPAGDIGRMALQAMSLLVPCSTGAIVAFDQETATTQLLAIWHHPDQPPAFDSEPAWIHALSDDFTGQLEPQNIGDLTGLLHPTPLTHQPAGRGRSILVQRAAEY